MRGFWLLHNMAEASLSSHPQAFCNSHLSILKGAALTAKAPAGARLSTVLHWGLSSYTRVLEDTFKL